MGKQKFNIGIRLIPAAAVLGAIITLAVLWTTPENRNGPFYYFVALLVYATIMFFFSDVIFLMGKKPLTVRIPFLAVAAVHIGYILLLLLLRLIFSNLSIAYFILATLIATSIQIALSLWLYRGVVNIAGQQQMLDQKANMRIGREVLLGDLNAAIKTIPALAQNPEMMHKLEVLCNAWKYSSEADTENTAQTTMEINASVQALIGAVSSGAADSEAISGQMAKITSLIERRNTLLKMK